MSDARTIETVESLEVDFVTHIWQVRPFDNYHVGAGTYLMVPVANRREAEEMKTHVMSFEPETRAESSK
ncbi:MAG TPA: hypothetical protein VN879_15960 [Candidatus Acidoferrales bacterium]|nr:hypothetical protein [Candidatus Acidoferrales bacterium]